MTFSGFVDAEVLFMARGVKPKPKAQPRQPLTEKAPDGLDPGTRAIYRRLARELIAEGYACLCDWRMVLLAAKLEMHALALEDEIDNGGLVDGTRLHPAVRELRAVRTQLTTVYAQLLLSPRSRVMSRTTESQIRHAGQQADALQEFLDE